ncbi:MAG: hypothetical protein AB1397_06225 [bacterium]
MKANIFLADDRISDKKLIRIIADKKIDWWIYLGSNYETHLHYCSIIPKSVKKIGMGRSLQSVAKKLRRPFIDLIGDLGEKYDSLTWWCSRISEKNPLVSSLFLKICYFFLLKDIVANKEGNILIISLSSVLNNLIAKELGKDGCRINWIGNKPSYCIITIKRLFVEVLKCALFFLFENIKRSIIAKQQSLPLPDKKEGKKTLVLHSWYDEGCFEGNAIKHRYFGDLSEMAISKGYQVIIIPEIYNIKRSYKEALRFMLKNTSKDKFYVPKEYFFRMIDYFNAVKVVFSQIMFKFNNVELLGLDISELLWEAKLSNLDCNSSMNYFFVKEIARKNIPIDIFIDTFEYMIQERSFQAGMKKYYPHAKRIGYMHFPLSPNLLCSFISKKEANYIPLPDKIVLSGEFFREILLREGYPQEILVSGPAIRYQYLWKSIIDKKEAKKEDKPEKHIVLLPLPITRADSLEICLKVSAALRNIDNIEIWLKPHPFMSEKKIKAIISKYHLPENYIIVKEEISKLLPSVSVGIVAVSSSALDLAVSGIPIVRIGSEKNLNIDPLDWLQEIKEPAYDSEEIRNQVEEALNLGEDERNELMEKGKELLKKYFNPVNDKTMEAFFA